MGKMNGYIDCGPKYLLVLVVRIAGVALVCALLAAVDVGVAEFLWMSRMQDMTPVKSGFVVEDDLSLVTIVNQWSISKPSCNL